MCVCSSAAEGHAGSVALQQPGSVFMSVVCIITKGSVDGPRSRLPPEAMLMAEGQVLIIRKASQKYFSQPIKQKEQNP